jgi:hypothetical protein
MVCGVLESLTGCDFLAILKKRFVYLEENDVFSRSVSFRQTYR